jgi:hypothetical protein
MNASRHRTMMILTALFLSSAATARPEPSFSERCRQEFAAVDDQADKDLQDLNRLVELLESEIADPALSSSGRDFTDGLHAKLEAAKLRRTEVFDKQHADLNAIRDRCYRART